MDQRNLQTLVALEGGPYLALDGSVLGTAAQTMQLSVSVTNWLGTTASSQPLQVAYSPGAPTGTASSAFGDRVLGPNNIVTAPSCRFSLMGSDPRETVDYAWAPLTDGSGFPALPWLSPVLSNQILLTFGWQSVSSRLPLQTYRVSYRTRPQKTPVTPLAPGVGSNVSVTVVPSFCPLNAQYLRWPRSQGLVLDAQPTVDINASTVPFVWSCVRGQGNIPCFQSPAGTQLSSSTLQIAPGYLLAGESNFTLSTSGGEVVSSLKVRVVAAKGLLHSPCFWCACAVDRCKL
jgi:hypothetical protein